MGEVETESAVDLELYESGGDYGVIEIDLGGVWRERRVGYYMSFSIDSQRRRDQSSVDALAAINELRR